METNNEVKTAKYHFKSIPGNAQLNIYYDPETTNEDYFVNAVNNYDNLVSTLKTVKGVLETWNKDGKYTNLIEYTEKALQGIGK